jgi:hypothetical protein
VQVPDGDREVVSMVEVITTSFTRLKAAHHLLDLVF